MGKRLYGLDNLKIFLTALVMLHHLSITYGASGSWYYREAGDEVTLTAALLTIFTAVNQTFFMGLFFFISGYFTPGSYDRKGAGRFWADRLLRLGIPLLVYAFGIGPALIYALEFPGAETFGEFYANRVLTLQQVNFGPMWFVEALLYMSAGYALWRGWTGRSGAGRGNGRTGTDHESADHRRLPFPSNRQILSAACCIGAAAFLLRLAFPAGWSVLGLQLGYFASYIVLFAAGTVAYRNRWLEAIPPGTVRLWVRVALIAIVLFPVIVVAGGALEGNTDAFNGGLNLQALAYAFWEPFVCMGISLWLLSWFLRRYHTAGPLARALSESAYTAFIIHPLVIVAAARLISGTGLPDALRFLLAACIGVPSCFALAWAITRIPFTRKIL